ncbi:MAG TPA: phosphoribosylformylglycinamidine synthase-associated small membrane protein [Hyphomicrobiaceae bacterium]|nr:phosphoribosylformylglycinamidine synthase-associated small membrane protein [Hyphomicrobiaceae bacterium]
MSKPHMQGDSKRSDGAKAMWFFALKAAVFMLVPMIAAVIAVVVLLK